MSDFSIQTRDDSLHVSLPSGATFSLPSIPAIESVGKLEPRAVVEGAFEEASALNIATETADRDLRLSPLGRAERLLSARAEAVKAVARAAASVELEGQALAQRETDLYAPLALEKGDAVGAALDAELRARFWAMPAEQRARIAAALDEHPRLRESLVRDPLLRVVDVLGEVIAAKWRERVEVENPIAVGRISAEKDALEWMRRGLNLAAAAVTRTSELSPLAIAELLANEGHASKGAHASGISPRDLALAKQRAKR
jgi:hypothetical protein